MSPAISSIQPVSRPPLEGKTVVLGVTGSIAAYKAADIASKENPGYRDYRHVAALRAHKLGIEPTLIREAILTHAHDATTRRERAGLSSLKKTGLDLSILKETDLPDVYLHRPKKRGP